MTAADVRHTGRVRVRSWRRDAAVAEVMPYPVGAAVSPQSVRDALDSARRSGYRRAVTPAMTDIELRPFTDAGFALAERLHLLSHDLLDLEPRSRQHPSRRAGRRDRDEVLEVDGAAFDGFWRLDRAALADALSATPSTRFRVNTSGPVRAYSVIGRAGDRGYIQRLAVHPSLQGQGWGGALVVDGLHWLRRWRVREVLVNTQTSNERAQLLYLGLGFRQRQNGLAVLGIDL